MVAQLPSKPRPLHITSDWPCGGMAYKTQIVARGAYNEILSTILQEIVGMTTGLCASSSPIVLLETIIE